MMMPIDAYINKKVLILNETLPAEFGAKAMRDQGSSFILLTDDRDKLTGIITDRDFSCRWGSDFPGFSVPLKTIMTRHVITASPKANLSAIIKLMETYGVRIIPIIIESNNQERILGVVTLEDILLSGMSSLRQLSLVFKRRISGKIQDPMEWSEKLELKSPMSNQELLERVKNFYAKMSESTGISSDLAEEVFGYLINLLIRRIPFTAAAYFMGHLPKLLREKLYHIGPGPDQKITAQFIIDGLTTHFKFTEEFARFFFHDFFLFIEDWVGREQIQHLKAQLPHDIVAYFNPTFVHDYTFHPVQNIKMICRSLGMGGEIPKEHTQAGYNRSPQLEWSHVPSGTKEFAVICEDLNALSDVPQVHWVIYNISPTVTQLPMGISTRSEIDFPLLAKQGKNSSGQIGYEGPLPHEKLGTQRFHFWIYALNREIILPMGPTAAQLRNEMRGHVIGEGVLIGTYKHKSSGKVA